MSDSSPASKEDLQRKVSHLSESASSAHTHHEEPIALHYDTHSTTENDIYEINRIVSSDAPLGHVLSTSKNDEETSTKEITRTPTNASAKPKAIIVPKELRRGLLSRFTLISECTNPYHYDDTSKSIILCIVGVASIIGPMGGAVFLPAMDSLIKDFNSTESVINISYGIYVVSLAIFPLWWSSFSEQFGRRNVYIISFTAYFAFVIGCARAQTIVALMVCRFMAGGCAASVQAVGAGTLSDIYIPTQRGRAMGYFYLGPLLGPLLGPIFAGLLTSRWGWRSTQWFLVIIAGCIVTAIIFFLPETLMKRSVKPVVKSGQITEKEKEEADDKSHSSIGDQELNQASRRSSRRGSVSSAGPAHHRNSISSQLSGLKIDDLDNTNVGDAFVPVIPMQSHPAESDTVWAAAVARYNNSHPNMPIMSDEAADENEQKEFNDAVSATNRNAHADNKFEDMETQINGMEAVAKARTTASEKEQKLMNASAQVDFRSLTWKEKMFWLFFRPLRTFKFFTYLPLLFAIAYGSLCFMILYFLNVGLEAFYSQPPYNFNSIYVGLCYIPNSLGYIIASVLSGRYTDYVVRREKAKKGYFNAESRFAPHYYIGMFLYPCSIIMFGWTTQHKVHWIIPLIANFFFGLSSMIVFGTSATYIVDTLPGKGSSGIALNNFVRFMLAAVSTFVNAPMNKAMGYGWMYTFLALLAFLSSGCIFAIKIWGAKWRSEADFEKIYR